MPGKRVNPTRMELNRLKKKLAAAIRGHRLLKDKRDELMQQFMELVRENKKLREKVDEAISSANSHLAFASASMPREAADVAVMVSMQEVALDLKANNVMGVSIPVFDIQERTPDKSSIYPYGFAFTSADLDCGIKLLQDNLADMLRLAQVEKSCQLLAAEIEKTRRRVNALEYFMIPEMQSNIRLITMKLDENERSNQVRLMKVKEMILEDTHRYSEKLK
ncbi:V-type ATP synthase subunit D (plasmid) [Peptoclostridium acidaminophilum DSM 3953]|uniref:V-type ATP synthase subunit D n=1 Tax=Peptoclostridium acidaminophilum DSM 3953 TaxID=1286171 RepID=W8TPG4_PEPAC|nr:V-type ATP synthase subunit D [Peptoclostridium acidaminophilum]AHM58027.1 V-type ATP synthase subunit D [Peptoclostridium acidaminophilum DSM 3953]